MSDNSHHRRTANENSGEERDAPHHRVANENSDEERDALNRETLFLSTRQTQREGRADRPKNTVKAYAPKQKEYRTWCDGRKFSDGYNVTEDKSILFLKERVLERSLRGAKAEKAARENENQGPATPGSALVETYIAALVDLWKMQVSAKESSHPNPRGQNLQLLLRMVMKDRREKKRREYADRGIGTMLDGYTMAQFTDFVIKMWETAADPTKPNSAEPYHRTIVDHLLLHYGLMRGEDTRSLELADVLTRVLENEGPTECFPLLVHLDGGKTNAFGRVDCVGVLRHKDYRICALGQLGFYYFMRWEIGSEPVPSFLRHTDWYDVKVLKKDNKHRDGQLSGQTQGEWIKRGHKLAGIESSKTTHSGRHQGAKQAEIFGVSEEQIAKQGRWDRSKMQGHYLSTLARGFMRAVSGVDSNLAGGFFIARAALDPPLILTKMVWPWVDEWQQRILNGTVQVPNMAAKAFLKLMQELRKYLLQDAVFWQPRFPNHPIFKHPVFHQSEWVAFADALRTATEQAQEPEELTIQKVVPVIADRLVNLQTSTLQQHELTRGDIRSEIIPRLNVLQAQWDDMRERGFVAEHEHSTRTHTTTTLRLAPSFGSPSTAAATATEDSIPIVVAGPSGSSAGRSSSAASPSQSTAVTAALPNTSSGNIASDAVPKFELSRSTVTVTQLWREWSQGLEGNPSVMTMDERYGTRWRTLQRDRQFYSLRKEIIQEIRVRKAKRMISTRNILMRFSRQDIPDFERKVWSRALQWKALSLLFLSWNLSEAQGLWISLLKT